MILQCNEFEQIFSLVLTGKIRRGATEMVGLKRLFTSGEYAVIQLLCIVLQCAYSGFTLHNVESTLSMLICRY